MSSPAPKRSSLDLDLILIITLVCLGISFWQTGMGYYKAFSNNYLISFSFAFVLVAAMFLQNVRLRDQTSQKRSTWAIFGVYALFAFASFGGNFNSFYSNFMGSDLIREELANKRELLLGVETNAIKTLNTGAADQLSGDIKNLITQMKAQIKNEGEPGVGSKARAIIKQVQILLGTTITILKAADISPAALSALADDYETIINTALNAKLGAMGNPEINTLITSIGTKVKESVRIIDNAAQTPENFQLGIDALTKAVQTYKYIGSQIGTLKPDFQYNKDLSVENSRIGKIDHAFMSARARLNKWGTWLAAFISLLIDFIPPFIIGLYAVSPNFNAAHEPNVPTNPNGGIRIITPDRENKS